MIEIKHTDVDGRWAICTVLEAPSPGERIVRIRRQFDGENVLRITEAAPHSYYDPQDRVSAILRTGDAVANDLRRFFWPHAKGATP